MCTYVHGDICEMCGKAVIYPGHSEQKRQHEKVTIIIVIKCGECMYSTWEMSVLGKVHLFLNDTS